MHTRKLLKKKGEWEYYPLIFFFEVHERGLNSREQNVSSLSYQNIRNTSGSIFKTHGNC